MKKMPYIVSLSIAVLSTGWASTAHADLTVVWCSYAPYGYGLQCEEDGGGGGVPTGPMPGTQVPPPAPPGHGYMIPHDTGSPPAIYRLINTVTGDHLLTESYSEAVNANNTASYAFEQRAGRFVDGSSGAIPLYRLRGPNGDHLMTTSSQEISSAEHAGYVYEGVAGYIFGSSEAGTCALYRLHRGNFHFFTLSWTEASIVLQAGGSSYEGVTGYVYPLEGSCPR